MATWRDYCITAFVLACFVILLLTPGLSLISPAFQISSDGVSVVSGYYGPGSVAAWLLLVFSNSEFLVYARMLFKCCGRAALLPDMLPMKVDSTIIGTAAYSLVTFGHLLTQVMKHHDQPRARKQRRNVTITIAGDVAQIADDIQAQVTIMYLTSAVSSGALIAHYYYYVTESLLKDEVQQKNLSPLTRRRRLRLAFWALMFTASQLVMAAFAHDLIPSGFGKFQDSVCGMATLIVVTGLFHANLEASPKIWSMAATAGCFFLAFCRLFVRINLKHEFRGHFARPQSSANLSDLDQAAALGVALVVIGTSTVKHVFQISSSAETAEVGQQAPTSPSVMSKSLASNLDIEADVTDAARISDLEDAGVSVS